VHILNKELVCAGMTLLKYFPLHFVDSLILFLAKIKYGDLSKYGLHRPKIGPFSLKAAIGRSPVIDVGTVNKIKEGEIKIFPGIEKIQGSRIIFENGEEKIFDAIVFATGYRSTANEWLKDFYFVLNEEGMPKAKFPNHWKGENGLYCAGLSSRGLAGIYADAHAIANDISNNYLVHILNKELVCAGMTLLKYFPLHFVDSLILFLAKIKYGDLSKYGLHRPKIGPFSLKAAIGRSPVIDVGTVNKIKEGEIKIFPGIEKIQGSRIIFENGEEKIFDAIVFATGYRSTANEWLKDFYFVLNEEGMPKAKFPNHWKGENGLYCAGLSSRGLAGIYADAHAIANDISNNYLVEKFNKL
ncbi:Flavin-containing monooxygenase, partial [Thalictrum thalictroides]